MRDTPDTSVFDWIADERTPPPPLYSPVPLSRIMPICFERYVKVLHTFSGSYDDVDGPLSREEAEILRLPDCTALKKLVIEKRNLQAGSRVLWSDVATTLAVPYAEEICHEWFLKALEPTCWPRFIDGPADGALLLEESRELVSMLESVCADGDCFFRLPEIPHILTDRNLLLQGKISEAPDFFSHFQYGPEYWWPQDHQWCVCSDYDLVFTVVGGSSELIDLLLKSKLLECIEVSPAIRIDGRGPIPCCRRL